MDVLSQHGELPESVDSPESVELPEYVDALPNICGSEPLVQAAINGSQGSPVYLGATSLDISGIDAAFAIALHMHQPLIPAAYDDPRYLKPSNHLVGQAMLALDAPPWSTTLVGDSVNDIQAARSAEVHTIGYANKPGKLQALTSQVPRLLSPTWPNSPQACAKPLCRVPPDV
jgi:HAD-hyrolase-like protein